jgi:hypothetical protein
VPGIYWRTQVIGISYISYQFKGKEYKISSHIITFIKFTILEGEYMYINHVFQIYLKKSFFSLFNGTIVWTHDFTLAKQVLYPLSHTASLFCSGYFWDRASLFAQAGWTPWFSFYTFHCSWHDRCMPTCPTFSQWVGVSQTFVQAGLVSQSSQS